MICIEEVLNTFQILPISNNNWGNFDVCLYSESSNQEYLNVKKKIRECVPKGTIGIYIIVKDKKVLYIGESGKDIHTRLRRHIDKIYVRTDNRSTFFKLDEHHDIFQFTIGTCRRT